MCLLTGVCLRQNIFSMVHLIFLIGFPPFLSSKHQNLNGKYGNNTKEKKENIRFNNNV